MKATPFRTMENNFIKETKQILYLNTKAYDTNCLSLQFFFLKKICVVTHIIVTKVMTQPTFVFPQIHSPVDRQEKKMTPAALWRRLLILLCTKKL